MVGFVSFVVDVEMIVLVVQVMSVVGFEMGDFFVCVNDCCIFDGVLEIIGVVDVECCMCVLCVVDKFDCLG